MANRVGVCLAGWAASALVAGCVPGVIRENVSQPAEPPSPGGRLLGPRPEFGRPRIAETAPPPISGGTLAALRDGQTAVAADPDRDRIFVVDYAAGALLAELPLDPGDEPGRVLEDADGRVHVVLRRAGALVTLARDPWRIAGRRAVCVAPRGIAFDAPAGLVQVACADGQLVSLAPEPDGAEVRRLNLEPDLRDVVVDGDVLLVSRFRSADVLTIDRAGKVIAREAPPNRPSHRLDRGGLEGPPLQAQMVPAVAWRLVGLRAGEAVLLHQRALDGVVGEEPGGYGGDGCGGGIIESSVSGIGPLAPRHPGPVLGPGVALAVDVAISPDGRQMAIVSPAAAKTGGPQLFQLPVDSLRDEGGGCGRRPPARRDAGPEPSPPPDGGADAQLPEPIEAVQPQGEATAVAFDWRGHLLVQTREPATVQVLTAGRAVVLSRVSREDTGHAIFHANSGSGLACASCHPEGTEDGRVWQFRTARNAIEVRRTQNLSGGLGATAPFHWNGDLKDLGALMTEVFVTRMNGPPVEPEQVGILGRWLDQIPALPALPVRDPEAAARGRALFEGPALACTGCHAAPLFTNNTTVDVGTGRALQVPTLRALRWRPPYMHDGCARTLTDRFAAPCGGGDRHSVTSKLTADQIADLAAYMETL